MTEMNTVPAPANNRLVAKLLLVVLAMFGFGYALVPLYDGEMLIEEMIAYLRKRKFAPVDIDRGHFDRTSWQQLQANILFAKV